jgi:hypothetical protein
VWFARAQASGDGTSPAKPIGSSIGLDAVTKPGDVIIVLASDDPLDGGVTRVKSRPSGEADPT